MEIKMSLKASQYMMLRRTNVDGNTILDILSWNISHWQLRVRWDLQHRLPSPFSSSWSPWCPSLSTSLETSKSLPRRPSCLECRAGDTWLSWREVGGEGVRGGGDGLDWSSRVCWERCGGAPGRRPRQSGKGGELVHLGGGRSLITVYTEFSSDQWESAMTVVRRNESAGTVMMFGSVWCSPCSPCSPCSALRHAALPFTLNNTHVTQRVTRGTGHYLMPFIPVT